MIHTSLEQTLFYLYILTFDDREISKMSVNSIAINIYGSTIDKAVLILDLKERLDSIMKDNFREELTFGFTKEAFPNLNPKYYGKTITYHLQKSDDQILIYKVQY